MTNSVIQGVKTKSKRHFTVNAVLSLTSDIINWHRCNECSMSYNLTTQILLKVTCQFTTHVCKVGYSFSEQSILNCSLNLLSL